MITNHLGLISMRSDFPSVISNSFILFLVMTCIQMV